MRVFILYHLYIIRICIIDIISMIQMLARKKFFRHVQGHERSTNKNVLCVPAIPALSL